MVRATTLTGRMLLSFGVAATTVVALTIYFLIALQGWSGSGCHSSPGAGANGWRC